MLIDYKDFIVGALSVVVAYKLFKEPDETEDESEDVEWYGDGRLVPMYCQTCRKQKKHREIEHNLYQCTKCKRHVDLR